MTTTSVDLQGGEVAASSTRIRWVDGASLFASVLVCRLVFAANRSVFAISPDEPANLAMARWLSGRGYWSMFDNAAYRPGLAPLLVPVFWITDDTEVVFRLALVVTAALGGIAAILLAVITRRLSDVGPLAACVVAGIVAITPAALSASAHVWSEPLVTVLFLATLLCLLRYGDRPSSSASFAAVTLGGAAYLVHSRMLPLLVVVALIICVPLGRRGRWLRATVLAVYAVALALASSAWTGTIEANVWTEAAAFNTFGAVAERLTDPVEVARSTAGQLWYVLASSLGIAGLGAIRAIDEALAPARQRARDHRILLAASLPLVALSIVFMADRDRVDQLIYGRYNDAILWPFAAIGLATIVAMVERRITGSDPIARRAIVLVPATIVITGLIVGLSLRARARRQLELVDMIAGLGPVVEPGQALPVLAISAGSIVLFVLIVTVALFADRRIGLLGVAVAAIMIGAAGVVTHDRLYPVHELGEASAEVRTIVGRELPVDAKPLVGMVPERFDPRMSAKLQEYYGHVYQWYLPGIRFELIRSGEYPPDSYVFAPLADVILRNSIACVLWEDPAVPMALWYTGTARCE